MAILEGISAEYLVQKLGNINTDLDSINGKLPSEVALSDSLSNPTTTIVGSALLGYDSANSVWRRVQVDSSGKVQITLE